MHVLGVIKHFTRLIVNNLFNFMALIRWHIALFHCSVIMHSLKKNVSDFGKFQQLC